MSFIMSALNSDGTTSSKHRRGMIAGASKLNLVSLMDIFTILVFFLMMNTGDVEILQPDEKVVLPQSFTQHKPDTSPVIKVSAEAIFFKEVQIVTIDDLLIKSSIDNLDKELINNLYTALVKEKAFLSSLATKIDEIPSYSISVMGDASVPYATLKRVLYTCAQAGFRDVSLAVEYSSRDFNSEMNPEMHPEMNPEINGQTNAQINNSASNALSAAFAHKVIAAGKGRPAA